MNILWKLYILPHILVFLWYRNKRQDILEDLSVFSQYGGGHVLMILSFQ